jgi:hypothetical protein
MILYFSLYFSLHFSYYSLFLNQFSKIAKVTFATVKNAFVMSINDEE